MTPDQNNRINGVDTSDIHHSFTSQEWRQLQQEGQQYILNQHFNDNDRGNNNSYTS
jgi:hypothetical protein